MIFLICYIQIYVYSYNESKEVTVCIDKEAMGKLTFEVKDMTRHSRKVVSLTGSWELERAHDRPGGHFLLIWRKIKGKWKIVVDHTSQKG